jgi:hypothetical protein
VGIVGPQLPVGGGGGGGGSLYEYRTCTDYVLLTVGKLLSCVVAVEV